MASGADTKDPLLRLVGRLEGWQRHVALRLLEALIETGPAPTDGPTPTDSPARTPESLDSLRRFRGRLR